MMRHAVKPKRCMHAGAPSCGGVSMQALRRSRQGYLTGCEVDASALRHTQMGVHGEASTWMHGWNVWHTYRFFMKREQKSGRALLYGPFFLLILCGANTKTGSNMDIAS